MKKILIFALLTLLGCKAKTDTTPNCNCLDYPVVTNYYTAIGILLKSGQYDSYTINTMGASAYSLVCRDSTFDAQIKSKKLVYGDSIKASLTNIRFLPCGSGPTDELVVVRVKQIDKLR